jgi:hypothetical protein
MVLVASIIGAVIFGTLGGLFVKKPGTPEGELALLAWSLSGIVVGIFTFALLGLLN